jgi:hypothetical protein
MKNVTEITIGTLEGGRPNGVKHEKNSPRIPKANEFIPVDEIIACLMIFRAFFWYKPLPPDEATDEVSRPMALSFPQKPSVLA